MKEHGARSLAAFLMSVGDLKPQSSCLLFMYS